MNKEEIIRLAREAGLDPDLWNYTDAFERFAALVAAHERNACAKVVEDYCGAWDDKGYALASAIRART
jgi:hypothetical protein